MYFEKPADWADEIYAYVYDADEREKAAIGRACDDERNPKDKYSYTFSKDWDNPLIIFNNGDHDTPSSTSSPKGLKVEPDKTYTIE